MGSRGSTKSWVKILGLWDPITSEPFIQTISSLYSNNLACEKQTFSMHGKGLESIEVRVTEIPNYTVKNRCFDMCWPISINNSVTKQCEVRAMYLH